MTVSKKSNMPVQAHLNQCHRVRIKTQEDVAAKEQDLQTQRTLWWRDTHHTSINAVLFFFFLFLRRQKTRKRNPLSDSVSEQHADGTLFKKHTFFATVLPVVRRCQKSCCFLRSNCGTPTHSQWRTTDRHQTCRPNW